MHILCMNVELMLKCAPFRSLLPMQFSSGLKSSRPNAGDMLHALTSVVPELAAFANLQLQVAFNKDSCRVGPPEWERLARILHSNRTRYDAFLIVHGMLGIYCRVTASLAFCQKPSDAEAECELPCVQSF